MFSLLVGFFVPMNIKIETNDSGYRMFDVSFDLIGLKASILVDNDFFEHADIKGAKVKEMTDQQLLAYIDTLTPQQIKSLIRMAIYEGRAADQEDLANMPNSKIDISK